MNGSISMKDHYKKIIYDVNTLADDAISDVTKLIQADLVNPFCKKYRVTFWSGMGGYGFKTRHGTKLSDFYTRDCKTGGERYCVECDVTPRFRKTQAGKELAEIIKVLELKGHPSDRCTLGAYMDDYKGGSK